MGKYKNDILRLRKEGKKYREIVEILGCTMSMVSYHLTYSSLLKNKRKDKSYSKVEYNIKRQYSKVYKDRNREIVNSYLKEHPCVDCGNTDLRVLDFDHVRGKKLGSISHGVKNSWPIEKLLAEINKCEVRCANCHRIVTHERRKLKTK
jgi:excinuclease UvrABC ATPase subunit